MTLLRSREEWGKLKAPLIAALAVLSLPLVYTALACHSYGRTPFRFIVDMFLRTLLIALPFCLGMCALGTFKARPWARRYAIYAGVMLGLITSCILIEAFGR